MGAAQTGSVTISSIMVTDERGSGAGWTLSVQSADLSSTNGNVTHTISFANITVTPHAAAASGTSSSAGALTVGSAGALSGADTTPGATPSAPFTLLTAPANQGMGQYTTSVDAKVAIPAKTYSGAYTATFVLSVQ